MKLTLECENPECEDNECLFNVEAVNIDRLFKRTEDLKDAYNLLVTADTDIQASINALNTKILEVEAALNTHIASTPYVVVTDADELEAALEGTKVILLYGDIEGSFETSVDGTVIIGLPYNGGMSSIGVPYSAGVHAEALKISSKNVVLKNIEFDNQNPLTNTTTRDKAIVLNDASDVDVSGLQVIDCYIHNTAIGIWRAGDTFTSKLDAQDANNILIYRTRIADFSYCGVYLSVNCKRLTIAKTRILGRDISTSHSVAYNGAWIGNNADYFLFCQNEVAFVGRHGLEYWNSQTDAETVGGNKSGKIFDNIFRDPLAVSVDGNFAITGFGADTTMTVRNEISGAWGIGIELYNDPVNTGRQICLGNTISGFKGQGISINNTINAVVGYNNLEDSANLSDNEFGMQIVRGAQNLSIFKNNLRDAGCVGIFLNGDVKAITAVDGTTDPGITIFTVSGTLETTSGYWYSGKEIYLRDFNGDVSYDALQGRHVMTLLNNDLTEWEVGDPAPSKFSVPVDSSAFAGTVPTSGILNAIYTTTSIKDNKIIHSYQHLSPFGGVADTNYAILAYEFQILRIADNECWHKDMSSYGAIQGWNSRGEIWSGDNADGGTSVGAITSIEGSNVIIEFE